LQGSKEGKGDSFGFFGKKTIWAALCVTVMLGSVYLATPLLMNTVQVGVFVLPYVSAYFSSAPSVPYQDVESVTQAMTWLNENMNDDSCVAVNTIFDNWRQLYVDNSRASVLFWNDAQLALDNALSRGYDYVYLVWWNQPNGWYKLSIPEGCAAQVDFGRISVYEFVG
jgi:hypothetical protein